MKGSVSVSTTVSNLVKDGHCWNLIINVLILSRFEKLSLFESEMVIYVNSG
jgi:hypothetical protein